MHLSDQEQKQLLKDWWKKYGNSILSTILVFAVCNFGWSYWNHYKNKRMEVASITYVQMLSAQEMQKSEEVLLFAKKLTQDFASTPYASLAAFVTAKDAVKKNNLNLALDQFNWVIKHSDNKKFKQISRVHAARILISLNKAQDALDLLKNIEDKNFLALIDEIKGDALVALNKKDEAAKAYKEALDLNNNNIQSPLLKLKLQQF